MPGAQQIYEILKIASLAGQDLRIPVMGGTQFPTQDSLQYSKSLLQKGRNAMEMSSSSNPNQLGKSGPTTKDITPNLGTTKGDLPQFKGASMDKIANDPLVQYLKKQAQDSPSELGLDSVGMDPPKSSPDASFSEEMYNSFRQHHQDTLKKLFENSAAAARRGLLSDKRG